MVRSLAMPSSPVPLEVARRTMRLRACFEPMFIGSNKWGNDEGIRSFLTALCWRLVPIIGRCDYAVQAHAFHSQIDGAIMRAQQNSIEETNVRKCYAWLLSLNALAMCAMSALGQDYPSKPTRIYPAGAGGGVDFAARLLAQGLSSSLGQPVVVENRGGSAVVAAEPVAKSAPDGYTLIFYGSGFWLTPFMRDKTPYDPVKDFAPISLTNRSPNVLVVHPSLPVKN